MGETCGRISEISLHEDAKKMALNENSFTSDLATESQVVIGLFSNGNDAQQAIGELREQGFRTNQIGAAFRETAVGSEFSNPEHNRAQTIQGIQDVSVGHNLTESSYSGSSSLDAGSLGGPASGSNAVTPAGLSSGSGMGISGAGRPGRIPGSDIPRSISNPDRDAVTQSPRGEPGNEWQQELRSDRVIDIAPGGDGSNVTILPNPTPVKNYDEAKSLNKHEHDHDSWWEKIKRLLTDDEPSTVRVTGDKAKSQSKFGTGEGDLGLTSNQAVNQINENENYDYVYSPVEFEGSLTSLGLDRRQARAFARELRSHGAIVTVAVGDRLADAERILESNNGRIRYEEDAAYGNLEDPVSSTQGSYDPRERIQVFGEVRRAYREKATSTYDENDVDRRNDLRRPA
jgi:hypothetical protein